MEKSFYVKKLNFTANALPWKGRGGLAVHRRLRLSSQKQILQNVYLLHLFKNFVHKLCFKVKPLGYTIPKTTGTNEHSFDGFYYCYFAIYFYSRLQNRNSPTQSAIPVFKAKQSS